MAKANVSHPYWPRDLVIPSYVANEMNQLQLLVMVFGSFGVILVATWILSGRSKKQLALSQRLHLCWFCLCGFIHLFLEGYFSVFHDVLAGDQNVMSQLWKEYGKGDSRYIISDNFTVCMETITAFVEGPGCFLVVYATLKRKPYRYIVQMLVSTGQCYGCILYFVTEYRDGFIHSEMWHPLYFWFYFVFLNFFWILVPFIMIIQAASNLTNAQAKYDGTGRGKKIQ
ncbi:3-beta-hydroxysteroid-Delta(8),Delta(7)-isomerase-like [Glandiceps talaboti]